MSLWKTLAAAGVGLGAYLAVAPGMGTWVWAMTKKAAGQPVACDWNSLVRYPSRMEEMASYRAAASRLKAGARDAEWGIVEVQPQEGRSFWVKQQGRLMSGLELVDLLRAEGEWNRRAVPQAAVKKGEIVLDVGAHVGTFTDYALRQGAAKVIQIEPDPVNVECLRRNFKQEIAEGRVILVPEGAWSKEDTLELSVGVANSGSSSVVRREADAKTVKIPVRPLDTILAKLGQDRVDYIKMDIEGAEKDALKGARQLITKHLPRIHLDANHLPDDATALPALMKSLHAGYQATAGLCECNDGTGGLFMPHTLYFAAR